MTWAWGGVPVARLKPAVPSGGSFGHLHSSVPVRRHQPLNGAEDAGDGEGGMYLYRWLALRTHRTRVHVRLNPAD